MKFKFAYIIISLLLISSCQKKKNYFNSEIEQIKQFTKEHNITDLTEDYNAGVFYKITKNESSNIYPGKLSYVTVDYTIKYINGSIAKTAKNEELYLNNAPLAWQSILPKLTENSSTIILATSNVAYNNSITNELNTNTEPLYFEIQLLSIK